jgi:hypothetical protein
MYIGLRAPDVPRDKKPMVAWILRIVLLVVFIYILLYFATGAKEPEKVLGIATEQIKIDRLIPDISVEDVVVLIKRSPLYQQTVDKVMGEIDQETDKILEGAEKNLKE